MLIEIEKLKMVEDERNTDYIGHNSHGSQIWEGTVKCSLLSMCKSDAKADLREVLVDFIFENQWTSDNGGSGVKKLKRPKGLKNKEWEELEEEVIRFLEDDYSCNKVDWEGD